MAYDKTHFDKNEVARVEFLLKAFNQLGSSEKIKGFLGDLMTPKEIKEFANRLDIARKLVETDLSYREIAKENDTSTATVTRVAWFLENGYGGYRELLGEKNHSVRE